MVHVEEQRRRQQRPVGNGADLPVPGDYDGDGTIDLAVFRPSTGTWFIVNSGTGTVMSMPWGNSADLPVPADYDGDGRTDIAVFRPSTGTWFIINSSTAQPWASHGGTARRARGRRL
jgi:putative transposon-encoded protein